MLSDTPPEPDAVILAEGAYALRRDGILHRLHRDGQPVGGFGTDIAPGAVSGLLAPLLLLELRSDAGAEAGFWLLDPGLGFLGASLDAVPAERQAEIAATIRPILDWLNPARLADGQPEPVAAFLSLQPGSRSTLARFAVDPLQPIPDPSARLDAAPAAPPADHTLTVAPHQASPDQPPALAIGRTGLILRDGDAPATLPAGWRAVRVCTLFFPTLLLELAHEDGEQTATWFLDQLGRLQGRNAGDLPPAARLQLARAVRPLFATLWQAMLLGPEPTLPPALARFLRLPEATRLELLALMLDTRAQAGLPTRTTMHVLAEAPAPTLDQVQTRAGQVVLDPAHLRAACLQSLQLSFVEQLRDGQTGWPSPVDGARVHTTLQPLTIDNLCFAYRLHDPRHDLTFYVVALEWHFRTFGLYIPSIDLMVGADGAAIDRLRLYCLDFVGLLQRHLVLYGDSIARGAGRRRLAGPGPLLQAFRGEPSLHIGHYVWQDLSGLDWLSRHVPATHLPYCLVFDSPLQAEMYGPIDQIHPGLRGRVIRRQGRFEEAIPSFYETASRPMKFTSMQVRRSVGVAVMDAIDRDPGWQPVRAAADAVPPGTPVVLIGLRVGNRAPENQAEFVCGLVSQLAARPGLAPVIVLDGHNQASEGATYRSVGDDRPGATPLVEAERAIAARVAAQCAALGLVLIDTVGRPVAHSLIWCRRAQFFVAPWGAALAKYRWICNRPGLVMTGRWNLANRHDLDIYDAPRYLEAPAELRFLPAGHVQDIPLPGEPPDRANFRIDEAAAFAVVHQLADLYPA